MEEALRPVPVRRVGRLELAMAHLVRVALNEEWSSPAAAAHLVDVVDGDATVLHGLRARILSRAAKPAGRFATRAVAILDLAMERAARP